MPDNRLPKLLLVPVKGCRPPGCLRSSFNDVAVHDYSLWCITQPYKDAQNRLLCEASLQASHTPTSLRAGKSEHLN